MSKTPTIAKFRTIKGVRVLVPTRLNEKAAVEKAMPLIKAVKKLQNDLAPGDKPPTLRIFNTSYGDNQYGSRATINLPGGMDHDDFEFFWSMYEIALRHTFGDFIDEDHDAYTERHVCCGMACTPADYLFTRGANTTFLRGGLTNEALFISFTVLPGWKP